MTFMRTAEILAQAGLADKDLARQHLIAQRDAANAQALSSGITGSLSALTNVGLKGLDIYRQGVADDAMTEAQRLQAAHKGEVGTQMNPGATTDKPYYAEGAGDVATNAVSGDAELNPSKPSGFFDSISSLLGDKEAAAAKARALAATGIANDVAANREKAATTARLAGNDAAENALRTQNIDESKQRMDVEKANADKTNAALAKAQRDLAVHQAIAPALVGMSTLAQINEAHPDFTPDELSAAYNDAKASLDAKSADAALKKSEVTKNNAEASKLFAEAGKVKDGKPLEEGARKDIATLQSQLDQIAALKAQKGSVDTGTLSAFQNSLAQFMGIDDPTKTQFRANTAQLRDELLHALSGAAVSPSEMSRLMEGLPSFSDNDAAYNAKLEATQTKLADLLKNRVGVEKASGANVSGIAVPSTTSTPGQTQASTPAVGPMIRVRLSDGRTGSVPASSFDPSTMVRL